jgi:hypothetical protein
MIPQAPRPRHDGSDGLLESYQYDHEGRRLADINPQRIPLGGCRGERR